MIQSTSLRLRAIGMAVLVTAAGAVGCPGTLQDPTRFTDPDSSASACPDVVQTVFLNVCATAQCHSSSAKTGNLDLQSPDVAGRLVGVAATGGSGMLIDPGSPSDSVIYTKLTATPPFGARMPFGQTPLDDTTIACVLDWVNAQLNVADAAASNGDSSVSDAETADQSSDDSSEPTGAGDTGSSQPPPTGGMDSGGTTVTPPPTDASSSETPDAHVGRHDASTGTSPPSDAMPD